MDNPFNEIQSRLDKIEKLLLDLQTNYSRCNSESDDQLLTAKQAAELLDLAIQTIYGLVSRREIPHSKIGNRLYFNKSDLNTWISQGRRKTVFEINEDVNIVRRDKS